MMVRNISGGNGHAGMLQDDHVLFVGIHAP